jgi:hypothetical protein
MMEEEKTRKLTRKRCPIGERFDKKLNKCVLIPNPSDPTQNRNNEKKTRKRCPKGLRFDPVVNDCVSISENKNVSLRKKPNPKSLNKTKKIIVSSMEKEKEEVKEQEEQEENAMIFESPISNPELSDETISQKEENAIPPKMNSDKLNDFLFDKEKQEYDESNSVSPEMEKNDLFLYPELNDSEFAYKIATRKEFNDTKYDGEIRDIKQQAEMLCNSEFELMPHQIFVKNFLSSQTPYNSLLLYHGLGSGKTCSAIGIAEEMRAYMKQTGIAKQIIVVASPNVQDNFRLQLFDERKLKEENGLWNINSCIGNTLLNEINPTNLAGMTRERMISQINAIIRQSYQFMGYNEFANYITKKTSVPDDAGYSEAVQKEMIVKHIKSFFNNRLIIIDEIHNLTLADNKQKRTSLLLNVIAKQSENMRLLLLSATPMYNSYEEIIWITNLMNMNDKRATIDVNDVFDKNGDFKKPTERFEGGRELLKRKLTGYVSYVRGENPYTFPYRVYPKIFAAERTLETNEYPRNQMNQKPIEEPLLHVPVFLNDLGDYQSYGYKFIMKNLSAKSFHRTDRYGVERIMPTFENMDTFGYTLLHGPLAALNIIYPNRDLDNMILDYKKGRMDDDNFGSEGISQIMTSFVGERGLNSVMTFVNQETPVPLRHSFQYRPEILKKYERIFSPSEIRKYSQKIATICECIQKSKGIVLVYSQFIDGGSVPIALALEEMGFSRFGNASHTRNLFKKPPCEAVDAITMKTRSEMERESLGQFKPAKYVMITGHKEFSPDNYSDVNYTTNPDNANGEKVKVILISKAAAEGLDFKNIRQIHILEPWYNMNRIEQIIGRGVRNLSHCGLPFEERNVEIYLHGSFTDNDEETADLYVYRMAEKKALQIGQVTRVLKEIAVDCHLNIGQTNFTAENIMKHAENQNIQIHLASGKTVDYQIGDDRLLYTDVCDYMDNCVFKCSSKHDFIKEDDIVKDTYNTDFMKTNSSTLMKRIRDLFRERSIYHRANLVDELNLIKKYPDEQIYYALTQFIENKTEELIDKYGRVGHLVNRGDYYLFQPNEITDENAAVYERVAPVDYKREKLLLELPEKVAPKLAQKTKVHKTKKREKMKEMKEIEGVNENIAEEYENILSKINELMETVNQDTVKLKGGEKDWYLHLNNVLGFLRINHEMSIDTIYKYTIFHILDFLPFSERLVLLKYVYSKKNEDYIPSGYEINIQTYFEEKIVDIRHTKGIALIDMDKMVYLVRSNESAEIWVEAEPEDEERIRKEMNRTLTDPSDFFSIVGFIHPFREKDMSFKIKNMLQRNNKNNKGARADQAAKPELINKLNLVAGKEEYTISMPLRAIGIAVMLEILMRYKTDNREAVMFFSPENTLLNRIIDV